MENTNQNNFSLDEKKQGLPEIAKKDGDIKVYVIIAVAFFMIMILSFLLHHKKPAVITKPVEEDFSVQTGDTPQRPTKAVQTFTPAVPVQQNNAQQLQLEQEKIALTQQLMQQKQKALQQRLNAPMLVVNNQASTTSLATPAKGVDTGDPNTTFMNQVSSQNSDVVNATNIGSLKFIVTEGTFISAVLETAINSDLPGYLRAIVNRPVYSADGSTILIPRGTRLIGEYKSGLLIGQSRVFVVWTRLITPQGIGVNIGSPGVDSLGQAGLGSDVIDRHFCQRFGTSFLLSIIGAGASNLGVSSNDQYNASQAYRIAIANSLSQSANQSLQQNSMISPTLIIYQGTPINVFVAHDLNFKNAMQQIAYSNVDVF